MFEATQDGLGKNASVHSIHGSLLEVGNRYIFEKHYLSIPVLYYLPQILFMKNSLLVKLQIAPRRGRPSDPL